MLKKLRFIILVLCTAFFVCDCFCECIYGGRKTDGKRLAVCHGYSPTMEGAQQAYADYENGMWQEKTSTLEETETIREKNENAHREECSSFEKNRDTEIKEMVKTKK